MSVLENLKTCQQEIKNAAREAKRDPADITLVAVSKKQTEQRITDALHAGQRVFGENRVQEALERWQGRRTQHLDLKLHLIGPLQTNKVKQAVALFDVIETLDREKLAQKLSAEMQKQNRYLPCLIQINTGEEEQKAGITPRALPNFLAICRETYNLNIQGLMCIPPQNDPPALHFALLKKLAATHHLKTVSMGMSADYQKAIALGATHIRIGTGVFGARPS